MSARFAITSCVDAGSEYCPCLLASTGSCLACPVQNGNGTCDQCAWSGACILAEVGWHGLGQRDRRRFSLSGGRARPLGTGAIALDVPVPRVLLDWLRPPGSFVMLRPEGLPAAARMPVSPARLDARQSLVTFFVQVLGAKSRALAAAPGQLVVEAPYAGGLVGLEALRELGDGHTLLVAKGIGQGPALHTAEALLGAGGQVDAVLGPGDLGTVTIAGELEARGARVWVVNRQPDRNAGTIRLLMGRHRYDLVVSTGSDAQHRMLSELRARHLPGARLVYTNNAVMCCGEGLCGSCALELPGGPTRGCKAQPDPAQTWGADTRHGR